MKPPKEPAHHRNSHYISVAGLDWREKGEESGEEVRVGGGGIEILERRHSTSL